ncbi:MAG: CCA tRNA nucleotidyltransferase [Verrucomicrobiota bacterium]
MEAEAREVVRCLQEKGHVTYYAGGCVRDRLRGVCPKDYDIATSATPAVVQSLFPKSDAVGAHFGVVIVRIRGEMIEVATFREDGDYGDGRRPDEITFSTPKRDAFRRDFTINGLFYDPIENQLHDYVGGQKDLESGQLRCIGDPLERFEEDYLRLLRAIRFATLLEFEIETETWDAIQKVAPRILQIAPERIQAELNRIWLSPNRVRGFDLLFESGIMELVLPEMIDLQDCEQPPQWHPEGDVFVHTRLMLSLLESDASLALVWSVLLHDIAKPATQTVDEAGGRIRFNGHDKLGARMAENILTRLRYSNAIIDAVVSAVSSHMQFKDVRKMRVSTLKRFMARETFEDELELHRVDCLGSNGILDNYEFLIEKTEEFAAEPILPPPFLNGGDLIERNLDPGPNFKDILTEAQDMQLEGKLTSREEALAWLDKRVGPTG